MQFPGIALNKFGIEVPNPKPGDIITWKTPRGELPAVCRTTKEALPYPQKFRIKPDYSLEAIDSKPHL